MCARVATGHVTPGCPATAGAGAGSGSPGPEEAQAALATRLRAHDWTAAAIELVIVVVGILIALQVSNWNDARHDRAGAIEHRELLPAAAVTLGARQEAPERAIPARGLDRLAAVVDIRGAGTDLGRVLGVSRAAVFKAVKSLGELGAHEAESPIRVQAPRPGAAAQLG